MDLPHRPAAGRAPQRRQPGVPGAPAGLRRRGGQQAGAMGLPAPAGGPRTLRLFSDLESRIGHYRRVLKLMTTALATLVGCAGALFVVSGESGGLAFQIPMVILTSPWSCSPAGRTGGAPGERARGTTPGPRVAERGRRHRRQRPGHRRLRGRPGSTRAFACPRRHPRARYGHIETMLTMLPSVSLNQAALAPSNSAIPFTVLSPISGTS